jgi:hypothetical protein
VLFNLNSTLAHKLDVTTKAKKPAWYVPNKEESMPKIGAPITAPKNVNVKVPPVATPAWPSGA